MPQPDFQFLNPVLVLLQWSWIGTSLLSPVAHPAGLTVARHIKFNGQLIVGHGTTSNRTRTPLPITTTSRVTAGIGVLASSIGFEPKTLMDTAPGHMRPTPRQPLQMNLSMLMFAE